MKKPPDPSPPPFTASPTFGPPSTTFLGPLSDTISSPYSPTADGVYPPPLYHPLHLGFCLSSFDPLQTPYRYSPLDLLSHDVYWVQPTSLCLNGGSYLRPTSLDCSFCWRFGAGFMLVSLHKSSFFTDLSVLEYSWATFSRSHLFYGLNHKSGDIVLNPSCYVPLFWYIPLLSLFFLLFFCLRSCLAFLVLVASFIASVWCLFTYLLRLACCPSCVCLFKGCDGCCSCSIILGLEQSLFHDHSFWICWFNCVCFRLIPAGFQLISC